MAEYTGIKKSKSGNYEVSIRGEDGNKKNFGTFTNAEAAGTVANYFARQLGKDWQNNTNMDINEAYHYKKRIKSNYNGDMYTLVDETISYKDYINNLNKEKLDAEIAKIEKRKADDAARYKRNMENLLKYKNDNPLGKHFVSPKYGGYTIIAMLEDNTVKKNPLIRVKFDYTGYEYNTTLSCAVNFTVRDPYYPSICGFGYTGERSIHDPTAIGAVTLYGRWRMMVDRIHNPENKSYNDYGGIGVTIAPEWAYFWNYYEDIIHKDNFQSLLSDPENWCIDKDLLQSNIPPCNRIYSNATTCIIKIDDNIAFSRLENTMDTITNSNNIGVVKNTANQYRVQFKINNDNISRGHKFTDPVAAAAFYDFYAKMNNRTACNYVDMDVDTAVKFSVNYGKKIMYKIVDSSK